MQIDIEANTTIGEESFFEGRFAIRGSLRIDGRFEGQALLVDQLQIGPKGRVKTNIIATSVVVEGLIIGNITSSRRILLLVHRARPGRHQDARAHHPGRGHPGRPLHDQPRAEAKTPEYIQGPVQSASIGRRAP